MVFSRLIGQQRRDFQADVAVPSVGAVIDGTEEGEHVTDILIRHELVDAHGIEVPGRPGHETARHTQCPAVIAFWKMDGLEVTPTMASCSIIR